MKKRIVFGIAGVAMTIAGFASAASDAKYYVGSSCSFSDSPLSAHSKSDHLFRNTTGSTLLATCPLVRELGPNSIEGASIEVGGSTSVQNVRLEQRAPSLGSVSGWAAETPTIVGGGLRYTFFSGSTTGTPTSTAGLAFEVTLLSNHFVSIYRLDELL